MPCRIVKDNNGKIIKVLDFNGKESKTFNKIASLPHVESLEQALGIYDEVSKLNDLDIKENIDNIIDSIKNEGQKLNIFSETIEREREKLGDAALFATIYFRRFSKRNGSQEIQKTSQEFLQSAARHGYVQEFNAIVKQYQLDTDNIFGQGEESTVFRSNLNQDKVYKVKKVFSPVGKSFNPFFEVDNLVLSNHIFPAAKNKIIGISIFNSEPVYVIEQNLIRGERPSDADIDSYLEEDFGLVFDEDSDIDPRVSIPLLGEEVNYTIYDLNEFNMVKAPSGVIIPIDPNVLPSEESTKKVIDKVNNTFVIEEDVYLKTEEGIHNSFKEALKGSESSRIELKSNGVTVATLPSTTDERTVEGVINSFIADNILEDSKTIVDGKSYFTTTGDDAQSKIISEEFFKENIKTVLPRKGYSVNKGLIEIFPKKDPISAKNSMHRVVSDKILEYFSSDTVVSKKAKISEANLKLNLMTILTEMGVSVTSLKQYQDKFKQKSQNIPPSAEALADVVNRIVAFKDGQLTLDNLTEEVMHLIVETLPQEEINGYSDLVRNSQEYQDYYEQYKDVYNNNEALIEKEILGKILKNITLNKVQGKENFVTRLFNSIKNFFNRLSLNRNQKDKLSQLNGLVERYVTDKNRESFTEEDLAKSKQIALMYSLSDQVSSTHGAFEKTFKNIKDFRQFGSYKRELKNISFENLKGRDLAVAVGRFVEMSTKLIETTESALESIKGKGRSLSGQNAVILKDLDNEIRANLDSLEVELSSPQTDINSRERNVLADKLRENSARISRLRASNDKITGKHVLRITDEVLSQIGEAEGENYRELVKKVIDGQIEDTNKIFSFFGQLHHASNPILNLIGSKIWEMNMNSNQGIKEDVSDFLNYIEDNNISAKEFESLAKDGYFEDVVDHKAFEDALLKKEMEAFSEASGQEFKNLEEYKKAKREDSLKELSEENYGKYRTLLQKKQLPLVETVMNEEYYKELFDKFDRLNISGATQAYLKQNSSQRGSIKANATKTFIDSNGKQKSRVVLTPEDNNNLNSISKIRKARKNIYSESSALKRGLKLSLDKPEGDSVLLPTGQYLSLDIREGMSQGEIDFANISFDLHKLDNDYAEKAQKGEKDDSNTTGIARVNFISYIKSIQDSHTEKEVFDIIMSNLDVSLSQEFYDNLNGDSFLKGSTLDELNPDKLELVKSVKELYAKRNSILSMYRNTSSPFEIDRMTDTDQAEIRSLTSRISNSLKTLTLPENTEENDSAGEKSPNKAYLQELKRKGIEQGTQAELKLLISSQHADVLNIRKIEDAFYKNQSGLLLTSSESKLLDRHLADTLLETQLNYAKSNLQPYYTRFAPIGYSSIEERINQGEEITDILFSVFTDPYLNVRVDNSFEEKDNPLKNPNYNDNYDGGFLQPKKGTFVNKKFINRFGINAQGEATKNVKLFEARRLYLEARKEGLKKMNETGANPYKVIQISRTKTEQLRDLLKKDNKAATAKELIKDTFAYRIDDLAYGEKGFESNRMLPKYYTRDLEDPSDVSTDYIYSLTQFVSRANEYKAKKEVLSDIDALYDVLLKTKRHSKSKDLKNTIAMANSYIENSIYGKIENRTYEVKVPGTDYSMDLAKLSRVFTKYVSLKNLGYNTTVPVTGYLSGVVSKKVEEYIGERLNKDSSRLANAEYKKLFKDGRSQALDFNDNSKLFLIGQSLGIYNISEKARNAKYNTFQRTFSKSAMALHTMANYPIIPKIALTVMFDNRIIDGKILNRQQYFQEGTRNGINREELEANWKAAEDKAIYNYMNFSKTGFNWDSSIKDLIKDDNYLEGRRLFMTRFIRGQVSNVDATIPQEMRLMAQRDAIGSMMLLHKGFLSIFLQSRLKSKGLNIDTGLIEEGSYRTLSRLMADFFNTKGNMKEKIEALKKSLKPPAPGASNEEWLDYELNVRNLRRVGKELAAMGILVALGSLVFAAASDPDNEDIYALQMTSYLTTRLLMESKSAFTPALLEDVAGVIESPITVYDNGRQFTKIYQLFDGDEVKHGKYRGLTVRERWLTKNVIGVKGVYDTYSAENIRQTESVYRKYNSEGLITNALGLNSLFESIYKK